MTVLASIGLLEYILRQPETNGGTDAPGNEEARLPEGESLHRLGTVLNSYGRGLQPESETEAAPKSDRAIPAGDSYRRVP
jgi:hypothetical protein